MDHDPETTRTVLRQLINDVEHLLNVSGVYDCFDDWLRERVTAARAALPDHDRLALLEDERTRLARWSTGEPIRIASLSERWPIYGQVVAIDPPLPT